MSSRSFCFTSFKKELIFDKKKIRYIIYGNEICPTTKRPHLQGYVEYYKPTTFKQAQKSVGDEVCWLKKRKGTRDQARSYCMKDKNFVEYGDWSAGGQGARNDLRNLMEKIKNNESDFEICEDDPLLFKDNMKFINVYRNLWQEELNKKLLKAKFEKFELNEDQNHWFEELKCQNNREVFWVCDKKGGLGKSTFASWMIANHNAICFTNGKTADIAYTYNSEKYIIFDFSRSLEDRVNYDVIEQLKNGRIFSKKYKSKIKIFDVPKIIIMANFPPDETKLSADRWNGVGW